MRFDWVVADQAFGSNGSLLDTLEERQQSYLFEMPATTTVWTVGRGSAGRSESWSRSVRLYKDALAAAKTGKKVVMVEIALSTCGLCKAMDAKTFPDKQVQQFMKDKTVPIKITFDKEKEKMGPELSKFLNGSFQTPTIIFIDPDGKELGRTSGFMPPKEFVDKAKSFVK